MFALVHDWVQYRPLERYSQMVSYKATKQQQLREHNKDKHCRSWRRTKTQSSHDCQQRKHPWSNFTTRSTTLGTTQRRPTLHTGQRLFRTSSTRFGDLQLHNRFSIPVGNSRYMQCRVPYKTTYSSRSLTSRSLQSRLQHVPCSSQKISWLRIDVAKSDWHRHLPPRPSLKERSNRLLIR
jgi:hypothetical protein